MSRPMLAIRSLVPEADIIHDISMEEKNWVIRPCKRSIKDELTMIDHVLKLNDDEFAEKLGVVNWLKKANIIFNRILKAIDKSELQIGSATTECNEEIDELEDLLQNAWSVPNKIINEYSDYPGMDLLISLIEYWIEEITLRGWVIHGLLVGSETCDDIEQQFSFIDKINYPPTYCEE